jgi:hypothetical protein
LAQEIGDDAVISVAGSERLIVERQRHLVVVTIRFG